MISAKEGRSSIDTPKQPGDSEEGFNQVMSEVSITHHTVRKDSRPTRYNYNGGFKEMSEGFSTIELPAENAAVLVHSGTRWWP
jgi:hypothetical protein